MTFGLCGKAYHYHIISYINIHVFLTLSGPSPISRTSPTWGNSWKMSWSQVRSALAALVPSGFLEKESQKTIVKLLVELCESDPWHIWNYLDTCWKILDSSFFQLARGDPIHQVFRILGRSRQRSINTQAAGGLRCWSIWRGAVSPAIGRLNISLNEVRPASHATPCHTLSYLAIAMPGLMENHQPFVAYIIHGYSILES